jgi:hypothetical protein
MCGYDKNIVTSKQKGKNKNEKGVRGLWVEGNVEGT